ATARWGSGRRHECRRGTGCTNPGKADDCARVHDIKVETLARCGAGWQPARRLATAAVRCQPGIWPIDNRPQLANLPHKSPRCLAYTYARIQAVLLMNRLGVHFCVAHPLRALPKAEGVSTLLQSRVR